jgi:hypothetical protein
MRAARSLACFAALCAGCASVLGIPDDTPSFCAKPENQGHAYCEDFDVGDATTRWTFGTMSDATYAVQPGSDRSPPNLLDLSAPAVAQGSSALAGFTQEFDGTSFVGLHIEADVRFVTQNGAALSANGGFMILVDKNGGGCIGLGLGAGASTGATAIGAVVFARGDGCSALTSGNGMATATGGQQVPLGSAPAPNGWFHVVVIATPDAARDGSGKLTFNIVGQPSAFQPVPLLPGTLDPSGIPLVGFAAEVNGPSGPLEVQYDNITIDLKPD